jgi:hypothetical protein
MAAVLIAAVISSFAAGWFAKDAWDARQEMLAARKAHAEALEKAIAARKAVEDYRILHPYVAEIPLHDK